MKSITPCALSAFEPNSQELPGNSPVDVIQGALFEIAELRERMVLRFAQTPGELITCAWCHAHHSAGWSTVVHRGRKHTVCATCLTDYAVPVGAVVIAP